jgi:capsular exopolysaccharide synthesis family protein
MEVYSQQSLDRKNHIASITVNYIEKQLNQISDSLNRTETNLQAFRSSNQVLNVEQQSAGISVQYRQLENQLAEMVTRKRYYTYVADYLDKNEDYSDMIVPAAMGIQDQLLNNLMAELITTQNQRSNLIQNNQEKNPLVQKLDVQIENTRKTISENIVAARVATDIQIDELNKRIRKIEAEIKRLPKTQRQLGGIERQYRLNDAIYNYLLEKRAEAKITQASNMPDNIIIEPANMQGNGPISPNKRMNYLAALVLGFLIPFGFLLLRSIINNKIESQENIESLTAVPVMGKILHNRKKNTNVVFDFPNANITESFRSLRTNLEYQFREFPQKVIMVTSSIQGEGKSFAALNLAMSYAQLGRMTLLIDMDLRKPTDYFYKLEDSLPGLSSYLKGQAQLDEIILQSPDRRLHYISSGPIPPNPTELLAQGNIRDMLEGFKNAYDCIILDSAPLAQVSDAYLLFDYSDVKVIIARYNYTIKKVFSFIMKDLLKKNINHTCVVLNDNRVYDDQYGYGYGYNKKK